MSVTKRILCLANSKKDNGRCLAGMEVDARAVGPWIRPVSEREWGELSELEQRYEDGSLPQVLDLVEVPLSEPVPRSFQVENRRIATGGRWRKVGVKTATDAIALGVQPSPLWLDGFSSSRGVNDQIPEGQAHEVRSSLVLVIPTEAELYVSRTQTGRRQVRAAFRIRRSQYDFAVTDLVYEARYRGLGDDRHTIRGPFAMCLSIGERAIRGHHYKLVASIIEGT